jgi:hypothetical protein
MKAVRLMETTRDTGMPRVIYVDNDTAGSYQRTSEYIPYSAANISRRINQVAFVRTKGDENHE